MRILRIIKLDEDETNLQFSPEPYCTRLNSFVPKIEFLFSNSNDLKLLLFERQRCYFLLIPLRLLQFYTRVSGVRFYKYTTRCESRAAQHAGRCTEVHHRDCGIKSRNILSLKSHAQAEPINRSASETIIFKIQNNDSCRTPTTPL